MQGIVAPMQLFWLIAFRISKYSEVCNLTKKVSPFQHFWLSDALQNCMKQYPSRKTSKIIIYIYLFDHRFYIDIIDRYKETLIRLFLLTNDAKADIAVHASLSVGMLRM